MPYFSIFSIKKLIGQRKPPIRTPSLYIANKSANERIRFNILDPYYFTDRIHSFHPVLGLFRKYFFTLTSCSSFWRIYHARSNVSVMNNAGPQHYRNANCIRIHNRNDDGPKWT